MTHTFSKGTSVTDKIPKAKPVTLQDYIPPDPEPDPRRVIRNEARLEALDKAVREDEARSKPGAKSQPKRRHNSVGEMTAYKNCTLFWNQKKSMLDIPLHGVTNIATFHLAPGYNHFQLFCQEAKIDYLIEDEEPLVCYNASVQRLSM